MGAVLSTGHLGRYYIAAWIALGLVWLVGAFTTKRTVRVQSRESRIGHTLVFLLAVLLMRTRWDLGPLALRFVPRSPAIALIGLALTVTGFAFAIWARFDLGRNWSGRITVKQDHALIRSGPYSIVRHPIYTGFIVGIAGTVLGIGEVHALIGFAFVVGGFLLKARLEERFMRDEFGETYVRYQRTVKAMIPFLW